VRRLETPRGKLTEGFSGYAGSRAADQTKSCHQTRSDERKDLNWGSYTGSARGGGLGGGGGGGGGGGFLAGGVSSLVWWLWDCLGWGCGSVGLRGGVLGVVFVGGVVGVVGAVPFFLPGLLSPIERSRGKRGA